MPHLPTPFARPPLGRLAVAATLAFLIAGAAMAEDAAQPAAGAGLPTVTVTDAAPAEMIGRVAISGTLVPVEEVLIYPQVGGYPIDSLSYDIGDQVTMGATLAHMNDRTLKAQLAQAEAELARAKAAIGQAENQIRSAEANAEQAKTSFERSKRLFDRGAATQASLDQVAATNQTAQASLASARDGLNVAKAQEQTAEAAREIAALNLDHATLKAPVNGTISARNGQIGAIASTAGEPIFRLIKDGAVEIEADVIETALGQITKGDSVELQIAGVGAATGTVRRMPATVDAATRLGIMRITVEAQDGLRPGLFASGWVITDKRDTLTVPTQAVLTDLTGSAVYVVKDGILERRPVTVGLIWNDKREIVSGLKAGETVVAKAGAFFSAGDAIKPLREGAAE